MKKLIPVWDNRQLIGHAYDITSARRVVSKLLQNIPTGWKITVRERNTEIINLPAGFVFSVHP